MAYSLSPFLSGYREILDDTGTSVGSLRYDPREGAWIISADTIRFPTRPSLPDVFAGDFRHNLPDYGAVLAFLGLPLPGTAPIHAVASEAA